MPSFLWLRAAIGSGLCFVIAADDGIPGGLFLNYGLAGALLAAGLWFLRWLAVNAVQPFVASTVESQKAQTAQMVAMGTSLARVVGLVEGLSERLERHMNSDERVDTAILTEIRRCHDQGGAGKSP